MAGLDPAIRVIVVQYKQVVDQRAKFTTICMTTAQHR
jgi:hypothetical protein